MSRLVWSFIFACLALPVMAAAPRPNIVILYADDMGYGDLAIQNPQSKIKTPQLDRLASQGLRLTDAHSSSGICTPSRYALLNGRYHWRKFHGIVNSFDQPVLDKDRTTLAALLQQQGYRTACIGKWHLGWDWQAIRKPNAASGKNGYAPDVFDWSKPIPGGPLAFGFGHYFGDDVPNFPPYAWFLDDRIVTPPTTKLMTTPAPAEGSWEARPGPAVEGWDFTAVMPRLTAHAVEWIGKQSAETPFLLYVPFTSPHAPIVPDKPFAGKSAAGGYGDFMQQTDAAVGAILDALDKQGLAENTIVIFSADNGPERYAYDRIKNYEHRSMGPLRGLKRDLWEGGHRVPMLVRWPGKITPGRVSDALFGQIDIYATIAAALELNIPERSAEDSYNQLPLWLGTGPGARDTIVHNTNPKGYAIRSGDWLLIDHQTGGVTAVPDWYNQSQGYQTNKLPGELYNLKNDLAQKNNLFAEEPQRVSELRAALEKIKAHGQVRPASK